MDARYAQNAAVGKRKTLRTTRMTANGSHGISRCMPKMSPEAKAAYDQEKIQAAMEKVRLSKELNPHSWAQKAGISNGSVRNFLKPSKVEKSMKLSAIMRLAWAAEVPVGELIGEPAPQPPAALLPGSIRIAEHTQHDMVRPSEILELNKVVLVLAQRNEELYRQRESQRQEVELLRQEVESLRQALLARPPSS